jgi:hypothetical protein
LVEGGLNADSAIELKAMSKEQTFRSEALVSGSEQVQVVQTVQIVQSSSLLPRVAGEETGGGWNHWNF